MTKTAFSHLGIGVFLLLAMPFQAPAQEPAQMFELTVGGKTVPVELDKPFTVEVDGKKLKMQLRSRPYRVFQAAGVRFRYPLNMGYEKDASTPGLVMYTLDGNDAVIMLMHFALQKEPREVLATVVDGLVDQYGAANVKKQGARMKLAGSERSGVKLHITVAGAGLSQEAFALEHPQGALVLVLQDSLTDDGKPTAEALAVRKMLESSFVFSR